MSTKAHDSPSLPENDLPQPFCGVVLAGGLSSRMGQDKAMLTLEEETLLARAQRILHEAGAEKVLVSGAKREQGISDFFEQVGPLGGIHAVLKKTSLDILVLPVDMPLLTADMLKVLLPSSHHGKRNQAITYKRYPVPAFIPNHSQTLHYIENVLNDATGDWSVRGLLKHVGHHEIEVTGENGLSNVNTPEEWHQLTSGTLVE